MAEHGRVRHLQASRNQSQRAVARRHRVPRRVAPGRDEQTDVGRPVADGDRVLIVEDVTTAGTSIRETVPVLRAAADVRLAGFVVSVDRMERSSDATDRTALA